MKILDTRYPRIMLVILSLCLFIGFVMLTVRPEIQYGTFEWTTSQFLNGVRNYLEYGPAALSYKAALMGGANPDAYIYGNMPTYHMILSYLMIEANILDETYFSLQFVTIGLFAALIVSLATYVFDKTGSMLSALVFTVAVLVTTGISYSYKDLWWEPYTLFFSFVPLLYMLKRPNARLLPLLLGGIQFIAVFDAVLFVAVGYLFLSWLKDRKIHRCAYYYAAGAIFGVSLLMLFRTLVGSGNVSGGLLLENMIAIEKADLIRFAYYYFADPQSLLIWAYAFLAYILTRELFVPVAFMLASLAWPVLFPAHAMHHAYHYSTVTMIGLLLYIFTANYQSRKIYYVVAVSYVLFAGVISVVLDNSRDDIDYAGYSEVAEYVDRDSVVGINIYSYPFSYYSDRAFKYIADKRADLETDHILIVNDFRQAEKGLHVVFSRTKAMTSFLGLDMPKMVIDTYNRREMQYLRKVKGLTDGLSGMDYQPVWRNESLRAVLFTKQRADVGIPGSRE